MRNEIDKPVVGITIGDINGIGPEIILKTFTEPRLFDVCHPVVYASTKILAYYKKLLEMEQPSYQGIHQLIPEKLGKRQLTVVNCIPDDTIINTGQPSTASGKAALISLNTALEDAVSGKIQAIITAPLNKKTVQESESDFKGHTDYIADKIKEQEPLMFMVSDAIRIGLVTHHIPIKDVADQITEKKILSRLKLMKDSLFKDFGIMNARIAVFGLNPHAGEEGLLGEEEQKVIRPAIQKAQENGIMAFGPYPADGFMGAGLFRDFDAILAMYHDQGLVAFKSVAFGSGVNFTAGLSLIRTSPDHGTGYDIAGKSEASPDSFRQALFAALDAIDNRKEFEEITANPLKKSKKESERY